jgi:hypothetical protein
MMRRTNLIHKPLRLLTVFEALAGDFDVEVDFFSAKSFGCHRRLDRCSGPTVKEGTTQGSTSNS